MNFQITLNLVLVGLTVLVSWLAWQDPRLMGRLILWPPAIARHGEVHRLVTYGFVHADGQHLLFNMITLFFFGRLIESAMGGWLGGFGYVLFYLGALVVSILPSYLQHKNDAGYRSLGASGAVSAVLFAFILLEPWAMIFVAFIPVPAIVYAAIYLGYSIWAQKRGADNVNHSAHLWGAAYGVVVLLILRPEAATRFFAKLIAPDLRF